MDIKPKKYYNTKRRKIIVKQYEQVTNISFEGDNTKQQNIEEEEKIEEMALIDFILKYYPNMAFLIEKK
jgi:hypothetical protein